jgi:hypothetical protein
MIHGVIHGLIEPNIVGEVVPTVLVRIQRVVACYVDWTVLEMREYCKLW